MLLIDVEIIQFTIEAIYISVCPVKMPIFAIFHIYIFLEFFERSRATSRDLAGHFWPAGHRFGTPDVYIYIYVQISLHRFIKKGIHLHRPHASMEKSIIRL